MNSEFSFSLTSCLIKAEEISLPYYLPIAKGRIIGFIPFPRGLVLCEMQSVSSRIWTRVAVSISFNDNHYTTGTSSSVTVLIYDRSLNLIVRLQFWSFEQCEIHLHCNHFTWREYWGLSVPISGSLDRLNQDISYLSRAPPNGWIRHKVLVFAQTRPAAPKMSWARSAFPWKRVASSASR